MNIVDFFKSMFGIKPSTSKAVALELGYKNKHQTDGKNVQKLPLDVEINRSIKIDSLTLEMVKEHTKFVAPSLHEQQISAIGKIDLGEGVTLYRVYLDDGDTWLQFACSGGVTDDSIDEITLFSYTKVDNPTSNEELSRLAGKDSKLGLPTYTYENILYERMWNSEEGQTELSPYTEHVRNEEGDEYSVSHNAMLYSRNLPNTERNELLLISVEEFYTDDNEQSVSVTTSVGFTVYKNDLNIH